MDWSGRQCLVVGLGLTGWSVVRFLVAQGAQVRVCDSRGEPPYALALAEQYPEVPLHSGDLDAVSLDGVDELVVSPGLDLNLPLFARARQRGLPLIGDIEIFARQNTRPVVAVTGSNGKSTVVTLLGEMAERAGLQVLVGGNIGTPALDLLERHADLIVLELSSFQLDLTHSLQCVAACVLNLSADHMDRHGSLQAYGAAKARIFAHAAHAIINKDDPDAATLAPDELPSSDFSVLQAADFDLRDTHLCVGGQPWLPAAQLKLVGRHNQANVLAAFALGMAAGLPRDAMTAAAAAFPGLPHRCQWVAERNGVRWINDSKGTNVGATLAALDGIEPKVVLLAGGQAKGGDFKPWRAPLKDKGRAVLLFGQDAAQIARDLDDLGAHIVMRDVGELAQAVAEADSLAQPGDSVLLSPGCASFDQFSGYAERGECFAALARGLA
ncbi:UDP-N-acetylmuramoyl-L-alanyl-D-glutamate synthetase [Oceanococcus atlanticus]|uniref:UDP-N-acetylmuramoylalanine--D-glutamate ligase n=1 Tax=Oceanococcus atlanticus TaxID=1317117 RepID=A0A1Y1SIY2_9GAMM|nr:UDP-N-acetylmuramoyl-L-alanine--D-glutamate ligase [Oceanococcus atlanticus]ORE89241.1 UDP-N-acetylmuramoyl-L-alanyl-D-glutamate synthetase [Oceanococcus atlanticus]